MTRERGLTVYRTNAYVTWVARALKFFDEHALQYYTFLRQYTDQTSRL